MMTMMKRYTSSIFSSWQCQSAYKNSSASTTNDVYYLEIRGRADERDGDEGRKRKRKKIGNGNKREREKERGIKS